MECKSFVLACFLVSLAVGAAFCHAQQVKLLDAPLIRTAALGRHNARDVPLRTSVYFELEAPQSTIGNDVAPESVSVRMQSRGAKGLQLLRPGVQFASGCRGWLRPRQDLQGKKALSVYLELPSPLEPETKYTLTVSIAPAPGSAPTLDAGTWSFTTEAAATVQSTTFPLDLRADPVIWHGQFFSGICNVIFCTQAGSYGPTYDLMAKARKQHPRAWSYQRDFWMTGSDHRPQGFLAVNLPNIVHKRETRRIAAIALINNELVLSVEDFFGHQQYGIPSGRKLGEDYHKGDEVLIADGIHDARTRVIATDEHARTVTVAPVANPVGGWKIAYEKPLPASEDPDAPGLFAEGGCYLRKFNPHGTACYYWGRLDKEWDGAHRRYGRRLLPNFADAPGDLSRDGRSWTTVKDYAQWHEVARHITRHIIERYGPDVLDFSWSVFNEPDLGPLFCALTGTRCKLSMTIP